MTNAKSFRSEVAVPAAHTALSLASWLFISVSVKQMNRQNVSAALSLSPYLALERPSRTIPPEKRGAVSLFYSNYAGR